MASAGEVIITRLPKSVMFTVIAVKTRCYRFRLWMGFKVMWLGAWITGAGFQVKTEDSESENSPLR